MIYRFGDTFIKDGIDCMESFFYKVQEHNKKEYCEEHCILAVLKKKDFNRFEFIEQINLLDIGGFTYKFKITIPRKLSLALLNLCLKKELHPMIIHSHVNLDSSKTVSFSDKDMNFINSFASVAQKIGFNSEMFFCVTNGNSLMIIIRGNDQNKIFSEVGGNAKVESL